MKNKKAGLLGSVMLPLAIALTPFTLESSTAAAISGKSGKHETANRTALPKAVMRVAAKCGACKPCNPCAGGSASDKCVVPRLQQAAVNPCAVKKSCNPCAPKNACGGCNPCAAKKACNPCAAKKGCGACNPCAAKKMVCGACNPCAAKCAAKKACNPCAAKKSCAAANPCNPCAAANPCNPCGGGNPCAVEPPILTNAESAAVYDCLKDDIHQAYSKSCHPVAQAFRSWTRFSISPYPAEAHGPRYLLNYANGIAAPHYKNYEDMEKMPVGSIVAKEGFLQKHDGSNGVGPLFIMEKKQQGGLPNAGGWIYTMIMPNGLVRADKALQTFCNDCHIHAGDDDDFMMFMPDEFRVGAK